MKQVASKNFFFIVCLVVCVNLFFTAPVFAEKIDTDGDGLNDELEKKYHTDPNNPDTDGDGFSDYEEIYHGYSPHDKRPIRMSQRDGDGDGLSDFVEIKLGTDMENPDSDGDSFSDFDELMYGHSPFSSDKEAYFDRKIVVDRTIQQLHIEVAGGVIIKTFPISTGNPATPTPDGTFSILRKQETKRYVGPDYDLPNTKWNMLFKNGGYYLHGAYWHNNFGKSTNSHGCINMRTEDAKIIYKYFDFGDVIEVIGVTPKNRRVGT